MRNSRVPILQEANGFFLRFNLLLCAAITSLRRRMKECRYERREVRLLSRNSVYKRLSRATHETARKNTYVNDDATDISVSQRPLIIIVQCAYGTDGNRRFSPKHLGQQSASNSALMNKEMRRLLSSCKAIAAQEAAIIAPFGKRGRVAPVFYNVSAHRRLVSKWPRRTEQGPNSMKQQLQRSVVRWLTTESKVPT